MMLPKTPRDYLLVRLEKAFEDQIATKSGVKLYRDTFLTPEWSTTVVGTVVSVPNTITKSEMKPAMNGFIPQAEVGGEIIFTYMVVFEGDPRDGDSFYHKNQVLINGEFLWKVDYQYILGYFKDSEIIPASGYVFLQEMEDDITGANLVDLLSGSNISMDKYLKQFENSTGLVAATIGETKKVKNKARIVYAGINKTTEPNLNLKQGDVVLFDQRYAMKYEIRGQSYLIIQQHYLKAKEV